MNKAELITAVAEKADLTKRDVETVVSAITEVIEEALTRGEKVSLVGFGTFEVRDRAARMGRNPQTKQEIKIPATRVPAFRAGKSLKDRIHE
ncbi:MAG: HU family DNA-binding protein [Bacillota bacterium]|nr:HU family DNA-binding protein [Bacillota bacterium]